MRINGADSMEHLVKVTDRLFRKYFFPENKQYEHMQKVPVARYKAGLCDGDLLLPS